MSKGFPSSLVDLRRSIATGSISIAETLHMQKDRMKNDRWNCVTQTLDHDDISQGDALPLAGVGLAHKDIFVMPDHQPLCGATFAPDFSHSVSPLIERLDTAGATTLAALTMAEFASGVTGENANYPLPLNPLDESLAVGGSSSGSGVAVAAGLCFGSLGTDTAGSVRIPAATCGVFALKPTNGLLEAQGCFPLAPSLDTAGIITRCALDASVLFTLSMTSDQQVVVMPEFNDVANRLADGTYSYEPAKKPIRIAAVTKHPNPRFSAIPSLHDAILSVAEHFSDAAVENHTSLDDFSEIVKKANTILHVEASVTHTQRLRSSSSELSAITRAVALPGAAIPSSWYANALQQRNAMLTRFLDRYFSSNDILLTPVLPLGIPNWESVLTTSPRFESTALLALFSWTSFVNYLGLPAVVFPIGLDANGLPISVQAIARPYNESTLLAFAHQAERKPSGTFQAALRSF